MIMKPEEVLYTDGHDVTVTYSAIQVKRKWYSLSGITKHGLSILSPMRISTVLLVVAGLALSLVGLFDLTPQLIGMTDFLIYDFTIQISQLFFWIGVSLLTLAALLLLLVNEQYAISITTAEGERNVIVSAQKEYILQILKALNTAYLARIGLKSGMVKKKKNYVVS
jgi:hypothetical protein